MAAVFDINDFNSVLGNDLVENARYHIVDDGELVFNGLYQSRDNYAYIFVEDDGNVMRVPSFDGRIVFYAPKPLARIRRMNKAS